MSRLVFGICMVIALALTCAAQELQPYRANGYVFAAPGVLSGGGNATLAFGGGGEAALWKGLGVNSEVGYLEPIPGLGDGFGLFSTNASYSYPDPTASFHSSPEVILLPFAMARVT